MWQEGSLRDSRMFKELPRADVERALSSFKPYHGMDSAEREKLYEHLCISRGVYDFRVKARQKGVSPETLRELAKLTGPLRRIANFGRQAAEGEARASTSKRYNAEYIIAYEMMREANKWAMEQKPSELPLPFRYQRTEGDDGAHVDYGAWDVIGQFFGNAKLIEQFAERVEMRLKSMRGALFDETPIECLAAIQLPKIYKEFFGKDFVAWVNDNGMSEGLAFQVVALQAMQIRRKAGPYSASTLRTHIRAVKRRANMGENGAAGEALAKNKKK